MTTSPATSPRAASEGDAYNDGLNVSSDSVMDRYISKAFAEWPPEDDARIESLVGKIMRKLKEPSDP
jgi:hypothetical protein